jgi:hypothetical protein
MSPSWPSETSETPGTPHAGMKLTSAEWDTGVKHLIATLNKFELGGKEREELLGAVGSLKGDIVQP